MLYGRVFTITVIGKQEIKVLPLQEDASEQWVSEGMRAFRSSGRDLDFLHRCLLDILQ